jgi:hypothetical protein
VARREGFEPPTARSVAWCSTSIWSAPDGSGLLTLEASSVWTDPDGSRRIVCPLTPEGPIKGGVEGPIKGGIKGPLEGPIQGAAAVPGITLGRSGAAFGIALGNSASGRVREPKSASARPRSCARGLARCPLPDLNTRRVPGEGVTTTSQDKGGGAWIDLKRPAAGSGPPEPLQAGSVAPDRQLGQTRPRPRIASQRPGQPAGPCRGRSGGDRPGLVGRRLALPKPPRGGTIPWSSLVPRG